MAKPGPKSRFDGMSAIDLAIVHDPAIAKKKGYIVIRRDGQNHLLHRWIWEQLVGPIPDDHEIDHENGIRHDCRMSNLRCVPQVINRRNKQKRKDNASGVTGVSRKYASGVYSWVVRWHDPITGKQKMKRFSINIWTEEGAKQKAIDFRATVIHELVTNHGYTTRHGT
jgi:hypothetical protein